MENKSLNNYGKAFAIGIGLNVAFIVVEVFYGFKANSSALLADAGHNISDVFSLVFAWIAMWLAAKKPKGKYTYGFGRSTILVAILNSLLLFGAVIVIGWDVLDKIENPVPVAGKQVMIVAGIGFIINSITALLFVKGQKDDMNIKGAFLHMAADAGVSLGVVISGFLIIRTGVQWIDPVMSLVIISIILWGTLNLFIKSVYLALDAVPNNIDIEKVRETILLQDGIENVHDLHIWAMSTTKNAMSVHLISQKDDTDDIIIEIQNKLKREFGISHITIQIEKEYQKKIHCNSCE